MHMVTELIVTGLTTMMHCIWYSRLMQQC